MQKIFLSAILFLGTLNGLIAQCLSLSACPAILQTVCDSSANDGQLWNDTYWFDPLQISHDLSEAPTQLSMQITDSCGPGDLPVSYVLLLDLDSDGIRETAISSNALPGADLVAFTACAKSACSSFMGGVEEVSIEISGSSPAVPPFTFFDLTGADGCASFDSPIPFAANLKITPSKDVNPLNNGLSTFDLILLGKHLNGTQPFTENWQWVAADTDVNGVIDSADLRHCKQLLLGEMDSVVYPGLRFYPLDFVFPVGNPLALPIPGFIMVDPAAASVPIEFAAVQTCDFNCNGIITDVEETTFSSGNIGPAQPNPTTAGLSIPLMLAQPASVAVEIADLSGRVVYRSAASYGAGDQRLEVPAQAFPQTGLYIWRVQAGEAWQTGRVLKQ